MWSVLSPIHKWRIAMPQLYESHDFKRDHGIFLPVIRLTIRNPMNGFVFSEIIPKLIYCLILNLALSRL